MPDVRKNISIGFLACPKKCGFLIVKVSPVRTYSW